MCLGDHLFHGVGPLLKAVWADLNPIDCADLLGGETADSDSRLQIRGYGYEICQPPIIVLSTPVHSCQAVVEPPAA